MSNRRNDPSLFLSAINQTIGEWSELRHVIEVYGAGGEFASDKLTWMGTVLFDYFKDTPNDLLRDEIHDYIALLVDNEFDFVPMDASLDAFICKLIEYHTLWSTGQPDKVKSIMEERRKMNTIKQEALAKESKSINETLTNLALGSGDNIMESSDKIPSTSTNVQQEAAANNEKSSNIDADGWTVVGSKKKNKNK